MNSVFGIVAICRNLRKHPKIPEDFIIRTSTILKVGGMNNCDELFNYSVVHLLSALYTVYYFQ